MTRTRFLPVLAGLLLVGLFLSGPLHAQPVRVTPTSGPLSVAHRAHILRDPGGRLTIGQVQRSEDGQWKKARASGISLGYTSDVLWLRLDVQPGPTLTDALLLKLDYNLLDKLELYQFADGRPVKMRGGDAYPYSFRIVPHRKHVFPLITAAGQTSRVYVRVETTSTVTIPIRIYRSAVLIEEREQEAIIFGIYFGLMGVMALYNLVLLGLLRDSSYFYYVAYIVFIVLLVFAYSGYGHRFLWGESPRFADVAPLIWMTVGFWASTGFAMKFLLLKHYSRKTHNMLWGALALAAMFFPLYAIAGYTAGSKLVALLLLVVSVLLLWAGVRALMHGFRPALFYLAAQAVFLAGAMVQGFRAYGLVPHNFMTFYASQIGTAIDVVLLSFALAYRIDQLKQEKERAESVAELAGARNRLLNVLAHDLRTPLLGIRTITESAMRNPDATLTARLPRAVFRAVNQIIELLDTLLTRNAIDSGRIQLSRQVLNLSTLVPAAAIRMEPLATAKDQKITTAMEIPDECLIVADRERFLQIAQNLLSNAIKYSPTGSQIEVGASTVDEYAEVYIQDQGPGILARDKDLLYKEFEPLGVRPTAGEIASGYGLAIVRHLADLHQWDLSVSSQPGQGSRFAVRIPLHGTAPGISPVSRMTEA